MKEQIKNISDNVLVLKNQICANFAMENWRQNFDPFNCPDFESQSQLGLAIKWFETKFNCQVDYQMFYIAQTHLTTCQWVSITFLTNDDKLIFILKNPELL